MTKPDRDTVTQTVYEESHCYYNAGEFIKMITEYVQGIPEEYRESALCIVDTKEEDYSDSVSAVFRIKYKRPETDEEYDARIAEDARWLNRSIQNMKDELERAGYKVEPKG
jgi:hypothetical protein